MKISIAVALVFCSATPAQAGFYSGNELHDLCQSNRPAVIMYVAGLHDASEHAMNVSVKTLALHFSLSLSKDQADFDSVLKDIAGYCLPENATTGQVADVFCKYLRDNPAQRHLNVAHLFSTAMAAAWPCPKEDR
jgi:Rap1a immunity proteins